MGSLTIHHSPQSNFNIGPVPRDVFDASMVVVSLAVVILAVATFQLAKIWYHKPNSHYSRRIVYMSVILQMLGCIVQNLTLANVINYPCWIYFVVQEFGFLTEAAGYFTLTLFWMNFYYGLKYGKSMWAYESPVCGLIVLGFAIIYFVAFCLTFYYYIPSCASGWKVLQNILYWVHVPVFIIAAIVLIVVAIKTWRKLQRLEGRFKHRKRALKVLFFVLFITVFRCVVDAVFEKINDDTKVGHTYWDTWVGFFVYFMLESVIPSIVFLIILAEIPSAKKAKMVTVDRYDSGYLGTQQNQNSSAFSKIINWLGHSSKRKAREIPDINYRAIN